MCCTSAVSVMTMSLPPLMQSMRRYLRLSGARTCISRLSSTTSKRSAAGSRFEQFSATTRSSFTERLTRTAHSRFGCRRGWRRVAQRLLKNMSRSQHRQPDAGPRPSNGTASTRARVARDLCMEAAAQGGAFELERWTSILLGRIWDRRGLALGHRSGDPMLAVGKPILESIVDVGGAPARTALAAVGRLDRGGLGRTASRLAQTIDASIPSWIAEVGAASVVRAFTNHSPGDGEGFFLESEPVHGTAHMLAVFVDSRLGGIAKHLGVTRILGESDFAGEVGTAGGDPLRFTPVDPHLACMRVREAIELTDAAPGAVIGEGFADHRALAIARVDHAGPLAAMRR